MVRRTALNSTTTKFIIEYFNIISKYIIYIYNWTLRLYFDKNSITDWRFQTIFTIFSITRQSVLDWCWRYHCWASNGNNRFAALRLVQSIAFTFFFCWTSYIIFKNFLIKKNLNPYGSRLTENHLHYVFRAGTSNFNMEIEKKNNKIYPTTKIALSILPNKVIKKL